MYAFLKWLTFLPLSILGVLAAWLVAPICPIFVDRLTWRLPKWLAWASTPHTDLRGDKAHRERFGDRNSYLQLMWWVIRNPAVVFQRELLGVTVRYSDDFTYKGDIDARDHGGGWWLSTLRRGRRITAFQFYCFFPYGSTGKGLRLLFGWKLWEGGVTGEPCQYCNRITIWKSA